MVYRSGSSRRTPRACRRRRAPLCRSCSTIGPNQGDPDIVRWPLGANNTAAGPLHANRRRGTERCLVRLTLGDRAVCRSGCGGIGEHDVDRDHQGLRPCITTDGGDLWTSAFDLSVLNTFDPVIINPGQTAVINVTITPSGPSGTVVSGNLYIDDFIGGVPPYGETAGDELAALPYTYTIK